MSSNGWMAKIVSDGWITLRDWTVPGTFRLDLLHFGLAKRIESLYY